jgi:hypothetical protein
LDASCTVQVRTHDETFRSRMRDMTHQLRRVGNARAIDRHATVRVHAICRIVLS